MSTYDKPFFANRGEGIFIIEGAITVGVCIIGWFLIVDFPAKAKFLTTSERKFVVDRINEDRGDAIEDKITPKVILHHLSDPKLYAWSFMLLSTTLPGYAYVSGPN